MGLPPLDHGEVVELGAGFEVAKGGAVPGVLDVGVGEEWGRGWF